MGDTTALEEGSIMEGGHRPPLHTSDSCCFQHEMALLAVGTDSPVRPCHRVPRPPRAPRDPRPLRGRRSTQALTLSLWKGFMKLLPISLLLSSRGVPGGLAMLAMLPGEFLGIRNKKEREREKNQAIHI